MEVEIRGIEVTLAIQRELRISSRPNDVISRPKGLSAVPSNLLYFEVIDCKRRFAAKREYSA